jgi:hypothetical protein
MTTLPIASQRETVGEQAMMNGKMNGISLQMSHVCVMFAALYVSRLPRDEVSK